MVMIRPYREDDALAVGQLIADAYGEYNRCTLPRSKNA